MTIITARKYEDKIVLAADSQKSYGNAGKELNVNKIFIYNDIIFGAAGSAAICGLLNIYAKNHFVKYDDIDSILDFLNEFNDFALKKTSNTITYPINNIGIILIIGNKLFKTSYFLTEEVNDFCAIGSGMFVALGAMSAGADPEEAVKAAIKYDVYCGGEISKQEKKFTDK